MYNEQSSVSKGVHNMHIALCTQMQGGVMVLFVSPAAPNPPTVTVTTLYGCGHLLEIKSQATEGVGCDLMCAFHITSPCHMAMCFHYCYRNLLMFTVCNAVRILWHVIAHVI